MYDRGRAGALAAVLVACLLAASACSDDAAQPKPLPSASSSASVAPSSASPSASPSASTTPTGAPTLPAAARGTSAASAKAFALHYVDLINYAIRSGQTEPLRSASDAACKACTGLAGSVDDVYMNQGHAEGGAWTVRSSRVTTGTKGEVFVEMKVRIARQIVIASPGASPSASSPSNGKLQLMMRRPGDRWTVGKLGAYS